MVSITRFVSKSRGQDSAEASRAASATSPFGTGMIPWRDPDEDDIETGIHFCAKRQCHAFLISSRVQIVIYFFKSISLILLIPLFQNSCFSKLDGNKNGSKQGNLQLS